MSKNNENKLVPKFRFPEFKESNEWHIKEIHELSDIVKGQQLNRMELSEIGLYPCLNGGINPSGYTEKYNSGSDTITISEGGNSCGYVNFMTSKFWLGGHCYKLLLKNGVNTVFYYQLLKLNESRIMKLRVGSGLPNIQQKSLRQLKLQFTKNTIEQQKIASCLSSLDEVITAEKNKLEVLKEHKKGLLQNLFPQEGETVPKIRFKEFEESDEWEEKILGEIAEIITGNTPSTNVKDYYGGDKMLISPADINDNRYVVEAKTTLTDLGFSKTRKIKADSVLFVCIGSTIGKVAQNKFECATNQQINSLVPFEGYSNAFIYSLLERYSRKIASLAGKQAVPLINKTAFSLVKLPFPTDIAEQQKIASCLSSLDDLINAHVQKIEALQLHKKGLLQGLFPNINEQNG